MFIFEVKPCMIMIANIPNRALHRYFAQLYYTSIPITRTPRSLDLSPFSLGFHSPLSRTLQSFLLDRLTRTRITRIPCELELKFFSFDQKVTENYPGNSNSGSFNSTRMPSHKLFLLYKVKTLKLTLVTIEAI